MDHANGRQQLLDYLFAENVTAKTIPESMVAAVASSRALIAELDTLSSALTGELSMLKAQTDQLLTCDECLALLDAYVEDSVTGIDVATRYPMIAAHLESCPTCQEQAELVYELLQAEAQRADVAPVYMTFEAWFQGQGAREQSASGFQPMPLWAQMAQQAHRLTTDIAIMLHSGKAIFGNLAGGLTPQLAPATVYRSTSVAGGEFAEFLELPHAEANLVVKVRLGPVVESTGTLVIEIGSITPPQPIARARVTLRDQEGGLLEAAQSDTDGFVVFGHLDAGKYQVQVEHGEQVWMFAITLNAA